MRILVTGYKSFIGRNLMSLLKQQTDWLVDGCDLDPKKLPSVKEYNWVIHLGLPADLYNNDIDKVLTEDYDVSCLLFNECQKHSVNLQYASSSSVYGHTRDYSEYSKCYPLTPHAWSKYLFDRWVFQQSHSAFVQGFRYFEVYGKWMHLGSSLLNTWKLQAKKDKVIELPQGSEHVYRDWVWVGDLCKLHLDFLINVKGSGIWNVGSGLSHSDFDLAESIAENTSSVIKYTDEQVKPFKMCADLSLLKKTVGRRKWLNVYEWIDLDT